MKKPIVGKLTAYTKDKSKKFDMLIEYQELCQVIQEMKKSGAKLTGCFYLNNSIKMDIIPPSVLDVPFRILFFPMSWEAYRVAEFQEAKQNIDKWFDEQLRDNNDLVNQYKPFISREEGAKLRSTNKPYSKASDFHLNIIDDIERTSMMSTTNAINLTDLAEEMRRRQENSPVEAGFLFEQRNKNN